jgi:O-antigen/teichoic acid export membrane protein
MAALLPGFTQAHLKRLAEGRDPGRCLGTMAAIQLALHGALVAALAAAWTVQGLFRSAELALVFLFMLAAQIATNFADIFLRVFIAREWMVPYAAILMAARAARLLSTVLVLLWVPSITWVAATFSVEGALSALGAAVVLASRYGITLRAPTRKSFREYWIYARPFLVTTPLALFQDSIDRVLVGRWAGLTAAGYYQVARALWEALSSVIAAPGVFFLTRLSSLYARRSEAGDREAREFFFGGLDKLLFLTVPLALGFWAFAYVAIGLVYGDAFRPAAVPLRILVLAAVAANIINPYTLVVYALDQAERFVPVNLLRAVTYLAVLVAFVPAEPLVAGLPGLWPGAAGAAVARLFLILFPAWVYFRWTRDLAAIPLYPRAWVYLGGFALMLAAFHLLRALAESLALMGAWTAVPAAGGALAVYLAYLFAAHPGTRDNLRYTLALLSPRGFVQFFREGLRGA